MIYKDARVAEVLEKAIDKACDNGYMQGNVPAPGQDLLALKNNLKYLYATESSDTDPESLIFDHDFAKAIWGTVPLGSMTETEELYLTGDVWKHHLQEMVLSEDPIAYLAKFI